MADTTDSTEEKEELDETEAVEEETPAEPAESDQAESTDETEETADEAEESDFKPRYTQFKGETPEEYTKNLEEGYNNSSKEAVRLSRELKELKAKEAQPETAPAVAAQESALSPALAFAEAQMQDTFKREYAEFAETHPEIETDLSLAEELDQQLAIVRDVIWNKDKRMVGMGEGLGMAWKLLGKDDTQENLRMAAKDQAASSKSASGVKKGDQKSKFSEEQISAFMDLQGVPRADAIKALSEYAV